MTQHAVGPDGSFPSLVERSYQMAQAIRQRYGMSRLELGLLLDTVGEQGLWRGKAESLWAYVDDLRINRNAARTYMRVARKFCVDICVSDAILQKLAACNMSVLEKAAAVITVENAEEVISVVLALHQRDAIACLRDLEPETPSRGEPVDDVSRLFGRYMELTDDARIDFLNRLRPKAAVTTREGRPTAASSGQ